MCLPQTKLSRHQPYHHTFEQKVRINLITNQLPLNAKLFEQKISDSNKCVNCDKIETQDHLFQCINTLKIKDELLTTMYSLMQSKLPKSLKNKNLELESIMVPREHFLTQGRTPRVLFGYFCSDVQEEMIQTSQQVNLGLTEHQLKTLHILFIDCWLTTFHKLIWLPRAEKCKKMINKTKRDKIKQKKKAKAQSKRPAKSPTEFQEDIPFVLPISL